MKNVFTKIIFLMLVGLVLTACSSDDDDGTTTPVTPAPDPFVFATGTLGNGVYTQVDRMGMPAIGTAVITSKDAYNQSNPAGDAALTFAGEIVTNVNGLHGALDDDLTGLGLVPCTVNPNDPFDPATSSCITQAAPLVVPDTLSIDTTGTAGFPNGRKPADPVMDVTLAVVLLDLGATGNGQTALSLVGVNPTANDKAFLANAPYLAAPHGQ